MPERSRLADGEERLYSVLYMFCLHNGDKNAEPADYVGMKNEK